MLAVLKIHHAGNVLLIFGIETLLALAAVNLGIFLSMFARTEFQAVQFIPLVIVPQMLLSGIVFPVSSEPAWMQATSDLRRQRPPRRDAEGCRPHVARDSAGQWCGTGVLPARGGGRRRHAPPARRLTFRRRTTATGLEQAASLGWDQRRSY